MLPDSICIISPPNYQHSETFRELGEGFSEGFMELGFVVPVTTTLNSDRPLVLGAHLLQPLPPNAIIYNTEQVGTPWFQEAYLELLRTHEVWDYSQENIEKLGKLEIQAKLCPIGYEPCLTRISQLPEEQQDVDVLFYGSIFGRRVAILDEIKKTRLNVKTLFGVYGKERDEWIARSKIVLNLHTYESSPFEIVRVSYLLANKKCVLTEPVIPLELDTGLAWDEVHYLPEACKYLCGEAWRDRKKHEIEGFKIFSSIHQSEYLREVI